MGTRVDTVRFICDQAQLGQRLTFRKMFGEYALYLDGKVVALVCDDQLFLKPTPEGLKELGRVSEAPPYPGAKNFYLLSAELDDAERLSAALQVTARALPEPRPKPVRTQSVAKGVTGKQTAEHQVLRAASTQTKPVAAALIELILTVHPAAHRLAWPKQRIVSFGFGPKKMSQHYAYLGIQTHHVNLGFYKGAALKDPTGILEGTGKSLRHLKIATVAQTRVPAVRSLLRQAIAEQKK